jgi:hypothetical protein
MSPLMPVPNTNTGTERILPTYFGIIRRRGQPHLKEPASGRNANVKKRRKDRLTERLAEPGATLNSCYANWPYWTGVGFALQ